MTALDPLLVEPGAVARRHPELRTLFFGLGAQKAATTWLAKRLTEHPECHVPALKELHYWSTILGPKRKTTAQRIERQRAWLARARRDLALSLLDARRARDALWAWRVARRRLGYLRDPAVSHYLRHLTAGHRGQPVLGEISPSYALLGPEGFAAMGALHPNTRFVFVLRDPVDRLWSGVRHDFRRDARPGGRIDQQIQSAFAAAVEDRARRPFRLSDYRTTIEALEAAVPRERILYLFFETLRTREAMDRLGAHLGFTVPLSVRAEERVNVGVRQGLVPDPATLRRAREALAPVYDFVGERFGDAVPASWRTAPGG